MSHNRLGDRMILREPTTEAAFEDQRLGVAMMTKRPREHQCRRRSCGIDDHDRVLVANADLAHRHRELETAYKHSVRVEEPFADIERRRAGDVASKKRGGYRARCRALPCPHPSSARPELDEARHLVGNTERRSAPPIRDDSHATNV